MNQLEKTIDDAIKYWADENNENVDHITNMILKCDAEFFGELYRIVTEKLNKNGNTTHHTMKTTIKPYLLKRRKTADGLYPVYIRITQKGSYSLYSTEIYIEKKSWNDKGNYTKRNWIKDHPSSKAWNDKIFNTWKEIETIIDQNPGIHRKQIIQRLNNDRHTINIQLL